MRAIAKRGIARVAAATEGNGGTSTETEDLSFLIDDFKIAFDANRTIRENRDFGRSHELLR